jgi:hypothetical protein
MMYHFWQLPLRCLRGPPLWFSVGKPSSILAFYSLSRVVIDVVHISIVSGCDAVLPVKPGGLPDWELPVSACCPSLVT